MKTSIISAIGSIDSPPPPPTSKRSRKTLIVVIVIVLIVVLAVGAYLATRGNGTNPSVTPTPTPSSGATPTTSPTPTSSGTGANVAGASSLQFTTSITNSSGASLGSYTYYAKNAGTSNLMIRIEFTDPSSGGSFVYIVNEALQQAWVESNGQWTDLSSTYASQFSSWDSTFTGYQNNLSGWAGAGDWSYTSPNGDTVKISNISVNPSLPDSLFEHS